MPFRLKLFLFATVVSFFSCTSQARKFETIIDLPVTKVKNQGRSATCWSFATTSFIEAEIIRKTGNPIELSPMYAVRHAYTVKAWNYAMRQGSAQFHGGGLAHDVFNSIRVDGLVPFEVYPGIPDGSTIPHHSKMHQLLKHELDTFIGKPKTYQGNWKNKIEEILNNHLGETINDFSYEGKAYTPQSFLEMTAIDPDDYVSITSFTHRPYYENFILNIPHNFSNGFFFNIKLEQLIPVIDTALENGHTLILECDATEPSFFYKKGQGLAIIPKDGIPLDKALNSIQPEKDITAAYRQQEFENFNTTDDHLMHITGKVRDQKGNHYYKVKNSWGADGSNSGIKGYMYISEAYIKFKTISVTVHKDILVKSKIPSKY